MFTKVKNANNYRSTKANSTVHISKALIRKKKWKRVDVTIAILTTLSCKLLGTCLLLNILLEHSTIDMLFLLATLFCWVYGIVYFFNIPIFFTMLYKFIWKLHSCLSIGSRWTLSIGSMSLGGHLDSCLDNLLVSENDYWWVPFIPFPARKIRYLIFK